MARLLAAATVSTILFLMPMVRSSSPVALAAFVTPCAGTLPLGTYGDVTVPPAGGCRLLLGTIITHNLTVQGGGRLQDEGARIGNDLTAIDPAGIGIDGGGSVGHDLIITGLSGTLSRPPSGIDYLCSTVILHNLVVTDGIFSNRFLIGTQSQAGPCEVRTATGVQVDHDVTILHNRSGTATPEIDVFHDSIGHDFIAQDNKVILYLGDTVGHDITMQGNDHTVAAGALEPKIPSSAIHDVDILNNTNVDVNATAGHDLSVTGTTDYLFISGSNAGHDVTVANNSTGLDLAVVNTSAGHDVNIHDNSGGVTTGIRNDIAAHDLNIHDNNMSSILLVTNNNATHDANCNNNNPASYIGNVAGHSNSCV